MERKYKSASLGALPDFKPDDFEVNRLAGMENPKPATEPSEGMFGGLFSGFFDGTEKAELKQIKILLLILVILSLVNQFKQ